MLSTRPLGSPKRGTAKEHQRARMRYSLPRITRTSAKEDKNDLGAASRSLFSPLRGWHWFSEPVPQPRSIGVEFVPPARFLATAPVGPPGRNAFFTTKQTNRTNEDKKGSSRGQRSEAFIRADSVIHCSLPPFPFSRLLVPLRSQNSLAPAFFASPSASPRHCERDFFPPANAPNNPPTHLKKMAAPPARLTQVRSFQG